MRTGPGFAEAGAGGIFRLQAAGRENGKEELQILESVVYYILYWCVNP